MKNQFKCTIYKNGEINYKIITTEGNFRINLSESVTNLEANNLILDYLVNCQTEKIDIIEKLYQNGINKKFPKEQMETNKKWLSFEKEKLSILKDIIEEIKIEMSMRNTLFNLDKVVTIYYNGSQEVMPEMEANYLQQLGEDIIY